jgi:predicted helicase
MTLEEYINKISQRFQLGNSTEHTFRGDLQQLLESIVPKIAATNEPKRIACGSPDFVLTKKEIPIGFIEAKDIGDKDLEGNKKNGNKEQFDRYKNSLDNIAFTDYLDFHFYQEKKFIKSIAIGKIENGKIEPIRENFDSFERHIKDFCIYEGQTITSPKKLAEMMAAKAQFLAEVIEKSLDEDEKEKEDSSLQEQFNAFKQILIKDITHKAFADVYAQTIAYGMFAARLHDEVPTTFTRQKAALLIPKSNPFLRKLFQYIAGFDLDSRLVWIVDSLSDIFVYANVEAILKEYGRTTQTEDALIHFYETFLAEYDPKLRKARGVWYTPKPVVNFIVRAVDEILKAEFDLPKGLTDSSKTTIKVSEKGSIIDKQVHKVQILDPATGTGTFLAETVEFIYKQFENQKGSWNSYVENDLLPRLNGFELLMASYAMAHLKLDFLLKETDFKPTKEERFRVFLTNSLEEGSTELETSFANWLSSEANEANKIKKNTPVMVIMGNPPYSGESQNKGKWIMDLMEDYKKEPEGKIKLKERNPKWINDDYVKFLRYGQHFIEKNGSGVLAFINPHGFLDNPTFRGMRWNLLKTYDKIYTIDLHGNSKKKEVSPDGSIDQNVFDIQQGVSINIFVKTGKKKEKELGKVFHYDLYGKRENKYDFLDVNSLKTVPFVKLKNVAPNYFMVQKDFEEQKEYEKGFSVTDIFLNSVLGFQTHRDDYAIDFLRTSTIKKIEELRDKKISDYELYQKYNIKDNRDWKLNEQRKNISSDKQWREKLTNCIYRPFDIRSTYLSHAIMDYPRREILNHILNKENISLLISRQQATMGFKHCFISNIAAESCAVSNKTREGCQVFSLYLYPQNEKPKELSTEKRAELELQYEEKNAILEAMKNGLVALTKVYELTKEPNKEIEKIYKNQTKEYNKLKEEVEKLKNALEVKQTTNGTLYELEEPRKPNLKKEIVAQLAQKLGLEFTVEKTKNKGTFAPIDILDYIYAVLHSPNYREKYKEFLKIDFPRVPYPTDAKTFWRLVDLGSQIRQIHLLESDIVDNFITSYPIQGENEVERPTFNLDKTTQLGKVYINETQFFDSVPLTSWEFFIGGYQPAQKWLKDRKGRKLSFEEINHYQKIVVALYQTDKLMKEVDEILI